MQSQQSKSNIVYTHTHTVAYIEGDGGGGGSFLTNIGSVLSEILNPRRKDCGGNLFPFDVLSF